METKNAEKWPTGAYCDVKTKVVHLPYDPRFEKKFSRASSPKANWKKIKLHG